MRPLNETEYIVALVAEGEHERQDFKYEVSDARKIARTLSAFANTSGGRLLVGVKDNGTLAGIQSEEEAYMIDAAARVFCSPPPQVTMKPYAAGGRTILVAEVAEAESKPVKVIGEDGRKTAYIRMADENILASTVHIAMWRQQHNPRGSLMRMCGEEQLLLDLFEQNERVNLETACETAHISRRKAANMIARLVRFGIVETFLSDHELCWRKNREK